MALVPTLAFVPTRTSEAVNKRVAAAPAPSVAY